MMSTTFAALFISQAYNLPLTLSEQFTMLLVLMKFPAKALPVCRVPHWSWWLLCCRCSVCPKPACWIILGVDQFLDMGRTVTNILGNSPSPLPCGCQVGRCDRSGERCRCDQGGEEAADFVPHSSRPVRCLIKNNLRGITLAAPQAPFKLIYLQGAAVSLSFNLDDQAVKIIAFFKQNGILLGSRHKKTGRFERLVVISPARSYCY